ncbi:MAG TPA: glutamate--tRNA ligase [Flavitalea sp.]|nr:glutamate--tRNA ligase [Flavitalea sp.]
MPKKPRVRFAPSPTGGLHLGGVRTVLYNYLFAHQHGGQFILRIEDTDQARYVAGAEEYIYNCLKWCGLEPDESPAAGGPYAPYRQSERKDIYRQYALQLVTNGHAYYAFDTTTELEEMRTMYKSDKNPSPQYNHELRQKMRNSLTLPSDEVKRLLDANTPFVIRISMPENEDIIFTDMIRGEVHFNSNQSDDKVLLKADGMPTYHLAVVVDDYLMKITHAFRGEEWLPSAPVHIMLWKYLGWEKDMPEWAHLPLILKPDGKGKLSKRDGDRLGFPVFAMDWKDPQSEEITKGFREMGFLPEAFINMLAMLGWNDGSENEIFSKEQLIAAFSMDRVHKGGAKFNFEKAKWFNHEWIKRTPDEVLALKLKRLAPAAYDEGKLLKIAALIKDRCTLLTDLWPNVYFFFETPAEVDADSIRPKWSSEKRNFFNDLAKQAKNADNWKAHELETMFKELATSQNIKAGDVLLPLRIMLVGKKTGPGVFDIAEVIGKEETLKRISFTLDRL